MNSDDEYETERPADFFIERDILGQQKPPVHSGPGQPEKTNERKALRTFLIFLAITVAIICLPPLVFILMIIFGGKIGG